LESNREINVAGLKPGIYFVEITQEQKEPQVIKLVKK
ncbi:MAG: T9SS type A sorting domain-containing protein, partial [Bacteroidales bacterium]|nr:T9SS type A sorting domain-containing protein [Bacteroidales bacterium]